MNEYDLSVVIPVHNEESTFSPLFREIRIAFGKIHCEYIVIDDGSFPPLNINDLNSELLQDRIHFHRWDVRHGSGYCRRFGSKLAKGKWVLWTDSDFTYLPEDMIKLWECKDGLDQVVGWRMSEEGSMRWLRYPVKRCIFLLVSILWNTSIPDLNSGMRIFSRDSLMKWVNHIPDGFSCTSTATLAALNHKQMINFIPIHYKRRHVASSSKFLPFRDTLQLLKVLIAQYKHKIDIRG